MEREIIKDLNAYEEGVLSIPCQGRKLAAASKSTIYGLLDKKSFPSK